MFGTIIKKFMGSKNEREIKRMQPLVDRINELEEAWQQRSEEDLRKQTAEWKERLSKIEDDEELAKELDAILCDAFAVLKNGCRRLCGTTVEVRGHELKWEMIPFDVQLIGGMGLHNRKIAEMATGEGKTLVATLPVYLNALSGRGVHVVTVNDYLAARDAEWMGHVYKFLGLTVGCIQRDQRPDVRREQYQCDITYGTNSEYGFDYLRDNGMATRKEDQVQRGHYFAIVDEVDSILIDEARTPLIISGPSVAKEDNKAYDIYKPKIERLVRTQKELVGRYLNEAGELLKKLESSEGEGSKDVDVEAVKLEAGLLLFKARQGNPRSPRFLQFQETAVGRNCLSKAEMYLYSDQTKKELYAQKEELFFAIDEKSHDADLTEKGRNFMNPDNPDMFMLPDIAASFSLIDGDASLDPRKRVEQKAKLQAEFEARAQEIHIISQLLKAYCLYELDVQYMIEEGKVVIIDENTGRPMYGRRWSDGLHQAVEAKEGVAIEKETQTLATVTIQNYFRLYQKLAGMTGTAMTEAAEFFDIYKMGVLAIPTNKPCLRVDANDTIYKTAREKFKAAIDEIKEIHKQGRPILVGTISVETSEKVSKMLDREKIPHSVLNARQHQKEAEIVSRAGLKGAVTIATNMAGRGTDIKLGPGVSELGGLHVLGTERHDSRRIDRQLRGRCSRQGDPGSSHFFISLEDNLMRLFGADQKIGKLMERFGMEEGEQMEHAWLNKSVENAQKNVEKMHFQRRKQTLEYDDVMNKQREVLYGFRNDIIMGDDVHDRLLDIIEDVVVSKVDEFTSPETDVDEWNLGGLADWVNLNFPLGLPEEEFKKVAEGGEDSPTPGSLYEGMTPAQFALSHFIYEQVLEAYKLKISFEEPEALQRVERWIILSAVDQLWQEHLYAIDSLRHSITLRAYGQRDPVLEFKAEAFNIFEELRTNIKTEVCRKIFQSASSHEAWLKFERSLFQKAQLQSAALPPGFEEAQRRAEGADMVEQATSDVEKAKPVRHNLPKVGRNDNCPCGSGKKYKKCCGKGM